MNMNEMILFCIALLIGINVTGLSIFLCSQLIKRQRKMNAILASMESITDDLIERMATDTTRENIQLEIRVRAIKKDTE